MGSFSFSSSQKRGLKGKQNQTMKIISEKGKIFSKHLRKHANN